MTTPNKETVVLITGGNNGVGLAACSLFSAQPSYHCIMASRSLERGQQALASLKASNPKASISLIQLDVDSDSSISSAVKEVQTKHGKLDILINNAGICPTDFNRSSLRSVLETNAISPAFVTQAFAPLLLKSPSPRTVYVTSGLGSLTKRSDPQDPVYSVDYKAYRMSKAALNMAAACDAAEYQGRMKVFTFCPGYVVTDLAGLREMKEKEGVAKSPEGSARGLLAIASGVRDGEAGKFLYGEEVGELYAW